MKSVVCNLFGMAALVACLGLILNRPAGAEDKEEQEVKEVTATTVMQTENAEVDVAQALQAVLREKMEGLPKDIQEKIREKLRGVKGLEQGKVEVRPLHQVVTVRQVEQKPGEAAQAIVVTVNGKQNVQEVTGVEAKTYVVEADGGAHTVKVMSANGEPAGNDLQTIRLVKKQRADADAMVEQARKKIATAKKLVEAKLKKASKADEKAHALREVTITAQAGPDGDQEKIGLVIAVDGDEISAKQVEDDAKTISVTLDGGQLIVDGKPIDLPMLKKYGDREIRVEVKKAGQAKRTGQRKMIFLGEGGKVQEFSFNVDVDVDRVAADKPHAEKTVTATAHVLILAKKAGDKEADGKKSHARSWTIRLDPQSLKGHVDMPSWRSADHPSPLPHAIHFDPSRAGKPHAEVTKRLKGIESELKKIRRLLKQMQNDDKGEQQEVNEEEENEEDEDEHEHEHEHEDEDGDGDGDGDE